MTTYGEWAKAFLDSCKFPVTVDNLAGVLAWMVSEYGIDVPLNNRALNNPLDTTEPYSGATDFNSAGVKDYRSSSDGLAATKMTLFNGRYGNIIQALSRGNNKEGLVNAVNSSPWGSKPDNSTISYIEANLNEVWNSPANVGPLTEGVTVIDTDANVTTEGEPSTNDPTPGTEGNTLAAPIVAFVPTSDGRGYYMAAADGGVFAFGSAKFHGSIPDLIAQGKLEKLSLPIIGMGVIDNNGYWLCGADGGVFAFGSAQFHGSI